MSEHDWFVLKWALILAVGFCVMPFVLPLQLAIVARLMRWNRVSNLYRDYSNSPGKAERCNCTAWGDIPIPCHADIVANSTGLHIAVAFGWTMLLRQYLHLMWPVTIPWEKIRIVGFDARKVRLVFDGVDGFSLSVPLRALQRAIGDNASGKQLLQHVLDNPIVNASQFGR